MARCKRRGFTLLELAVAMGLMGVVGLSFAHLYVNSQRYLTQSILSSAAQGEASYAMEHIKRQLLNVVEPSSAEPGISVPRGDLSFPQTSVGQLAFRLQRVIGAAPINAVYQLNTLTKDLEYTENGGSVTIVARNIIGITFTRNSRVQLLVNITAEQRTTGGDMQQTQLAAVVGIRGMV